MTDATLTGIASSLDVLLTHFQLSSKPDNAPMTLAEAKAQYNYNDSNALKGVKSIDVLNDTVTMFSRGLFGETNWTVPLAA